MKNFTHNTTQHNTTQHNTTQHNTTQHNTTQHTKRQRLSLFIFCLLLCVLMMDTVAFGQSPFNSIFFSPQLVIHEVNDPSGGCPDVAGTAAHANACSREGMSIYGQPSDLYVYTWDSGPSAYINYGVAVRQYPAGTPVKAGNPTPYKEDYLALSSGWTGASATGDPQSIDAAILQMNGNPYILICYYDDGAFYIELYQWTSTGTLVLQPGYPQNITSTGGLALSFDWINLDAIDLDKGMITWSEGGTLFARSFQVSPTAPFFQLGAAVKLIQPLAIASQVDVAMNAVNNPSDPSVHFVYTDAQKQKLEVAQMDFSQFVANPPSVTLNMEFQETTTGTFEQPRIDAPDHFPDDDWSFVVSQQESGSDYITTGIKSNGSIKYFNINDQSQTGFPPAIQSKTNLQPVVAYDNTGTNIYYCWYYEDPNSIFPPISWVEHHYCGMELTNTGTAIPNQTMSPPLSAAGYWLPSAFNNTAPYQSGIAMSTQNNDAAANLFMSFLKITYPNVNPGLMGIKTAPFTSASFRPGDGGITGITVSDSASGRFTISPNPFQNNFRIESSPNNNNTDYQLELADVTGRRLALFKGNISSLNQQIEPLCNKLPAGNYFGQLMNRQGLPIFRFKVTKSR